MSYRIVKRKNSLHKDKDEFVLQTDVKINAHDLSNYLGRFIEQNKWSEIAVYATLDAAVKYKQYLETGLNPGEEIVG